MKKNFTYSIAKEVEKELDRVAHEIHRSKSSIVQEAVQDWLRKQKDK